MVPLSTGSVFSITTPAEDTDEAPLLSVAVALQKMLFPTSLSAAVTVYVAVVPTVELPMVHSYVGMMVPSSTSVAAAEHVSSVPVYIPVLGDIEASTVKVGERFSTVTESELVMLSPSESVAVAVQVMESPTLVSLAETV